MSGALDYLRDELAELDEQGLLLHPRTLEGPTGARARFDGRDVINLASNNYLGPGEPPPDERRGVQGRARARCRDRRGPHDRRAMTMHRELERRFAEFKHAEDALMFQSGFTANAGTVAAILDKQDVIVSDRLNHASIIDGARLSRAEIRVFEHKDADHADRLLQESKAPDRRQLLDHRRRVLDGRRHRAAPGAGRGRRAARGDHDDRRRARLRGPRRRGAPGPSITSASTDGSTSRSARCPRRSACWGGSSPARAS